MKNLAFHSLADDELMFVLPILITSLLHIFLKSWENVLFELGSERVNSTPNTTANTPTFNDARRTELHYVGENL